MSWGAEDLSAALGASSKYDPDGKISFTYRLARTLCLAGAVAAGVQPVDGVFADFKNEEGLAAEASGAPRRLHRKARHPPSPGGSDQQCLHPHPTRSDMPVRLSPPSKHILTQECCPLAVKWLTGRISSRRDAFSNARDRRH